jgi:hypothetical protein
MKCFPLLVFLTLAACSPEPATTPPSPAPAPELVKAPLPPVDEVAGLPRKKPAPSPERGMAARPQPKPAKDEEPTEIHLPAFTFRTMDHKEAKVELNGEPMSTTPCLWSISRNLKGDEKITLDGQWPPTGGRFIATTKSPDDPDSKADLWVIDKPELLEKLGVGRAGECVLVVRGMIRKIEFSAALRLRVYNYRFTDFTPLDNPEGDTASKFLRTLWFERIDDR